MVAQVAGDLAEHHPAHRAAQADQSRQRAQGAFRNHVGGQNHDQRGPRLLAKKREAENENHPADGMQLRHQQNPRHQAALTPSAILRDGSPKRRAQQPARKSAADQAAHAGRRVGNPADAGGRVEFDLERFHQKFGQPEHIEIPRRVA